MRTSTHQKSPRSKKTAPKKTQQSSKWGKITARSDNSETEVNERDPHLFAGARPLDESEGLPYKDIPRHIGVSSDDENEIDAGLFRVGAGDRGVDSEEEALEALESDELRETGL